ncbi:TonB-dependent receptor [uncultured Bacteroides sp.]|uniref:SusC/RagA family TonB-linked outer membrane protein n=1 Tax=uncultured Bacteroides sp. TaxID=162156 RepID=UPI002AAB2796|nr:TonB-dependent receptor [uncultured Bacteroides sp.]
MKHILFSLGRWNTKLFVKPPILIFFLAASFVSSVGIQSASAAENIVQQQKNTITGVVTDAQGELIFGANVKVQGDKLGTTTNIDGAFKLNAPIGAKLVVSFIGYETKIVVAKGETMKIVLTDNSTMLKDVEIVAYGVQKKVTLTGAVSSIKSEELVRTPVSSVNNVLAGQLSGVTTIQYSGEPGSDAASIFVRGQATWTDSSPLIQVDGVERSMSDIDPNEIESVTVLKDASATAVFGVRGANGVVLITTKRGKEEKAKISVTTSSSILTPTKMVEQANSYEYATFYNQMRANDGLTAMFSDAVMAKFKDHSDPIRFPDIKWANYIMKDATLQTQHNINITGGSKDVRYFISVGAFTQGGLFKEFGQNYNYGYQYNRFNYRSNLDIDVTKTTTLSFNIAGNVSNADKPNTGQGSSGMIKAMYQATPFSSPGIIDGKYISTATDYDDVQLPFVGGSGTTYFGNASTPGGFTQTNYNKLQFDLLLDQKLNMLTKGLSFKAKGSYNNDFSISKTGAVSKATYFPVLQKNGNILYKKSGENGAISYTETTGKGRDWYLESSLNYNRTFGLNTITALLLYNQSKDYYYSSSDYPDIPRGYVGLVGRVTYDWNNRYMAEFNVGYNGSENFAPSKRFGTFPAGSIGWIASEENFFKPLKPIVNFMKLRASWGLVGNDKIGGSRFMYLADPYGVNNATIASRGGYAYNFGIENSTLYKGAYEDSKNNPDVTWEKAFKQDYGVDANFLNDRLRTTFDYYYEHRTNILLIDYTAPSIIGFTVPYTNQGIVNSWGWEASAKWQDKIGKDFRYWAGVNLSYNQNKIIEEKESPMNNDYQYAKGHRIGARSMYQLANFYYSGCEADYKSKYGVDFPTQLIQNIAAGDAVYVDLDKNGKIDENDMTRSNGYTDDPEYLIGFNFGFKWKNLEVSSQWTGAWNVTRMISDVFRQPFLNASGSLEGGLLKYHLDHTWTAENPSQGSFYPRATWANAAQNYATSNLYEKDAKYLRLKTLQVAYDLNFPLMKKVGLNQMQLALSGYNLLTFSPYIWGDPETRASSSPSYPLQRTYTLSLKLGF